MQNQDISNLQCKITSQHVTISTTESNHSTNLSSQLLLHSSKQIHQASGFLKDYRMESQAKIAENYELKGQQQTPIEPPISARLFTFMNENSSEMFAQNYINKNQKTHNQEKAKERNTKSLLNLNIAEMIETSRRKRQDFLNKIQNKTNLDNYFMKSKKLMKSKTPKSIPTQHQFSTIERDKSKTPRQSILSATPKDIEKKMFRATSVIAKSFAIKQSNIHNHNHQIERKSQVKYPQSINKNQKKNISLQNNKQNDESVLILLKKKKELEKQLLTINSTLMICKKKSTKPSNLNNKRSTIQSKNIQKNVSFRKKSLKRIN